MFGPAEASPSVWYADAPLLNPSKAGSARDVDQNYCALHAFRDMRAVPPAERAAMQPAIGVSLFEDMGFLYPRTIFRR